MVLLFDFDGTIADSFESFLRGLDGITEKYKLSKLSDKEIKKLRSEDPRTIIKTLHIPLYKIPLIVRDMKKLQKEKISEVKPFLAMSDALQTLKEAGYTLGIVTSNGEENVESFLKRNNLMIFDHIQCDSSMFGKDKVILKFLQQNNLPKDKVLYIGDEIRDIEACRRIGIKIIAVTWGFNSRDGLGKYHPDYLIDNPEELVSIIKGML